VATDGDMSAQGPELWVMLMEKAWAAQRGGFNNMDFGMANDGLKAVTGKDSTWHNIAAESADTILNNIWHAVQDGKPVLRKGYGLAEVELGVPIRPDMVFRVGSVTKEFTSACILMLAEQGRLKLDDDIAKYLHDYPSGGRKITIEQLLTHTSGIHSYTDMPAWHESTRNRLRSSVFQALAQAGYVENTRNLKLQTVHVADQVLRCLKANHEEYVLRCIQVAP
jgi:CubicO group peptidase (beta-lactamase class C family)